MNKLPKYLEPGDVEELIVAASTEKNRLIILTLYTLGLRVSECTGIMLEHIDRTRRNVLIHGKGGFTRILPVPDYLYEQWMTHIMKRRPVKYLFENCFKEKFDERRIRTIVEETSRNAGIEHTWPHKLRHSRATQLLNNGLPLPTLQRFLGHAQMYTTAIYTHLALEPLRKAL
jgi:site-specific recombinase XerD